MEINRNQYFLIGLVLLLLGLQFRMIDSVLLTPECTKLLAERTGHPVAAAENAMAPLLGAETKLQPKTLQPPDWVGYSLLSLGAVLVLHSFAMARPE